MTSQPNRAAPTNKQQMVARLRDIVGAGWLRMDSEVARYNGTGGPGNFLEDLLGIHGGSRDVADCVEWEVKFYTPKTVLITLFHKEPDHPENILRYMVSKYGWKDRHGRLSFRHTIRGESDRRWWDIGAWLGILHLWILARQGRLRRPDEAALKGIFGEGVRADGDGHTAH